MQRAKQFSKNRRLSMTQSLGKLFGEYKTLIQWDSYFVDSHSYHCTMCQQLVVSKLIIFVKILMFKLAQKSSPNFPANTVVVKLNHK